MLLKENHHLPVTSLDARKNAVWRAKVLRKGSVFIGGAKIHEKRVVLEAGKTRHSLVGSSGQVIQRSSSVSFERVQFGQGDEDVMKMAHPLIRRKSLLF